MTLSPPRALAGHFYCDPAVFEIEKAGLMARTWQFAGHASRLKRPGDYLTFELAGESLFCVRDRDGLVRCFYNVCQHRAHHLVSGEGNASLLVCPYHAWTYELSGRLRGAPNARAVPGFDRSGICLTEVRCEVFLGFVFVNLDPAALPMDDWFPRVRAELEDWIPDWEALEPLEWVEIPERCNWKVSVENYSECYHCSLNHPTFAKGVVRPETYDIRPQGYCLRHTTECQSLERMTYPIDADKRHAREYSSWFLWPLFSFQVYPGNLLNSYHWRPLDAGRVVVWRGWFTPGGHDDEAIRRLARQDRTTTVEEDIRLVESVQRGLGSRGYRPGPLIVDPKGGVRSEHALAALQGWMRDAVEGAR